MGVPPIIQVMHDHLSAETHGGLGYPHLWTPYIKTPIQAIPPEAVDLGAFAPLSGRASRGAARGTWSSVEVTAFRWEKKHQHDVKLHTMNPWNFT